ncbi:MAG: hypothetical protein KJ574_01380 [Nanoarchaeota archaeon]|nr:hypothetical protein [Nanoarchaeota archaeon]
MSEKRNFARIAIVLGLFILILLGFSVFAVAQEAGQEQASNGFERIGQFFKNKEFANHSVLVDFGVFFLIFFSLCWLGFSRWFGEGFGKPGTAKGAVIGLSLGLALMFSLGLVISGKFTIAKSFPIAKNFLFLAFWLLLYSILSNDRMIGSDTWLKKATAFMLAGILVYVLANIATGYVCSLENNEEDAACQGGVFTLGKQIVEGIWKGLGGEEGAAAGGAAGGGAAGGGAGDGATGGGGVTPTPPTPTNITNETDGGCVGDVCQVGGCPWMDCRLAIQTMESTSLSSLWSDAKKLCKELIYGPQEAERETHEKWKFIVDNMCSKVGTNSSDYQHALGAYHYTYGIYLKEHNNLPDAIRELAAASNITSPYRGEALEALQGLVRDQFDEIKNQINIQKDHATQLEKEGKFIEAVQLRVEIIDAINILARGE